MGTLMTICPVTGRHIEAGIDTDKRSLAASGHFSAVISCPLCRQDHVVSAADSWVCETIGGHPQFSPEV
jgi:hypothetical protein